MAGAFLAWSKPANLVRWTLLAMGLAWEVRFGHFESASRFCSAFDELRDYVRVKRRRQPTASLADQRQTFIDRWRSLVATA